MDELEVIRIEAACTRLVLRFDACLDGYRHAALVELFTPDGVWTNDKGSYVGQDGIRAYLETYPFSRMIHMSTNILVDVVDADHATSSSYFAFYGDRKEPHVGVKFAGRIDHAFRRTGLGWKIARHDTRAIFQDKDYDPVTIRPVIA